MACCINRTNVDSSSVRFCGIHLETSLQRVPSFIESARTTILYSKFDNYTLKFIARSPRIKWFKPLSASYTLFGFIEKRLNRFKIKVPHFQYRDSHYRNKNYLMAVLYNVNLYTFHRIATKRKVYGLFPKQKIFLAQIRINSSSTTQTCKDPVPVEFIRYLDLLHQLIEAMLTRQ